MADKQTSPSSSSLRKGIIVFSLLLACIVAAGFYLWQQSQTLNGQYDQIDKSLSG